MRFRIIPLEERIVLDAAGVADIVDSYAFEHHAFEKAITSAPNPVADNGVTGHERTISPDQTAPTRVLVVSSQIQDAQTLADAANGNTRVILYDPLTTSLKDLTAKIATALNGSQAESISFANEGANGQFSLIQGLTVTIDSLNSNHDLQTFWQNVGNMIKDGGRIDLLACNLAQDTTGQALVTDLQDTINSADANHITIAASTDITGNSLTQAGISTGGNWTLEIGNVDVAATYFDANHLSHWSGDLFSVNEDQFFTQNFGGSDGVLGPRLPGSLVPDYVIVSWGDGTTSKIFYGGHGTNQFNDALFTTTDNAPLGKVYWLVRATHQYVTPGYNDVTVTAYNFNASNSVVAFTDFITVVDAPLFSSFNYTGAGAFNYTADGLEGTSNDNLLVGTFVDFDARISLPADYTAVINWGDGTISSAINFDVATLYQHNFVNAYGTHTYASNGVYHTSLSIRDVENTANGFIGATLNMSGTTITIADQPLTDATVNNISLVEASPIVSGVLATFTDGNTSATVSQFATPVIDWGDSTTSNGTITLVSPGSFSVSGTHTYAAFGNYSVGISINDSGGSTTPDPTNFNVVLDGSLTGSIVPTINEGPLSNAVIAHFSDADSSALSSNFSNVITWGDGTTSSGTIVANGTGFDVLGTHNYASKEEGSSHTIGILVTDTASTAGAILALSRSVNTQDAPLTGIPQSPNLNQAVSYSNLIVAKFTDADLDGTVTDYTATINWNDGSANTTGTITIDADGGFDVLGSHTFGHYGNIPITVTVTDAGGSRVIVTSPSIVHEAPPVANNDVYQISKDTILSTSAATGVQANDTNFSVNPITSALFGSFSSGTTANGGTVTFNANGSFSYTPLSGFLGQDGFFYTDTDSVTGASLPFGTFGTVFINVASQEGSNDNYIFNNPPSSTGSIAGYDSINLTSGPAIVINWGDGTTSTGSITDVSNGVGNDRIVISGSHQYENVGSYTASASYTYDAVFPLGGFFLNGAGNHAETGTLSEPLVVADAPIINGTNLLVSQTFSGAVATFQDTKSGDYHTDFTASVDWGDGTALDPSTTISYNSGSDTYTVNGSHTYSVFNHNLVKIYVTDIGGSTATIHKLISIDQPPASVTAVEGSLVSFSLGTLLDFDPNGDLSQYSGTIDWGDGSTSSIDFSISTAISGTHTYLDEGTHNISVSVYDILGASATTLIPVTINDAPLANTLINPIVPDSVTFLFSGPIATFRDTNPGDHTTDFTATVDWGDSSPIDSSAVITYDSGLDTYSIDGGHQYGSINGQAIVVRIFDDGVKLATLSTNIDDAITIDQAPASVSAVEGALLSVTLGTVLDNDPNPTLSQYSGTINWGDGSPLSVIDFSTSAVISGTHTYLQEGSHNITVDVEDVGGASTLLVIPVTISDAALSATPVAIAPQEGLALDNSTIVAHFTDADPNGVIDDYSATITWGDGNVSTATNANGGIVSDGNGGFNILGGNTYSEDGAYTLSVDIADSGGATVPLSNTITVVDAPLTDLTLNSFTPLELNASDTFSTPLAHFIDTNPNPDITDFSAIISWGDGQTSLSSFNDGTITYDGLGPDVNGHYGFNIYGSHTYGGEATSIPLTITVNDIGTSTITSTQNINVADFDYVSSADLVPNYYFNVSERTAMDPNTFLGAFTNGDYLNFISAYNNNNPSQGMDDFTAVIDWGDHTTSIGTIAPAPGGFNFFQVFGGHTYADEGTFTTSLTIQQAGHSDFIASGTINVAEIDSATFDTTFSPSTTENSPVGLVAHFLANSATADINDFNIAVNWGDSNFSTAGLDS